MSFIYVKIDAPSFSMRAVLIAIFMLISLFCRCQEFEPNIVREEMKWKASIRKPQDTVMFENYRYVYLVKGDGFNTWFYLLKKERLYFRPWTAAGVTYFTMSMTGLYAVSVLQIHQDKYLHFAAGYLIGLGANAFSHRFVKNKWACFFIGLGTGALIGIGKEAIDPYIGGTRSSRDALATISGAAFGSFGFRIVLK